MEDDGLPQNICEECIGKTLYTHNYVLQCQKSDVTLRDILKIQEQHKLQNEDVSDVDIKCNIINLRESDEIKHNFDNSFTTINKSPKSEVIEDTNDTLSDNIGLQDNSNESTDFHSDIKPHTQSLNRKKVQKLSGPPYNCNKCKLSYKTVEELRDHRKQIKHVRPKNHTCTICSRSFTYTNFKLHMRTHTMEKPYECELCQKKFSLACNLRRHIMTHTGERPHQCELCGKGNKINYLL